jgi:hypothetical protein
MFPVFMFQDPFLQAMLEDLRLAELSNILENAVRSVPCCSSFSTFTPF